MSRIRLLSWVLLALLTGVSLTGCGGASQKGINQDLDRPKSPDTRK